jgi:N-methylhydantoinase A
MRSSRRIEKAVRVAIDTGGTFTDCVWMEGGYIRMVKVFSTPEDPSRAIVAALQKAGLTAPLVLLHGTTVGTNTLLQRRGARVALVATEGFEDVIEIGRQARPKLYDLFFDRIEPLVPAELRFGVGERTSCEGQILRKPSRQELELLKSRVKARKPEAIAISLLFGFTNAGNERAVARALRELKLPLSISYQILPEFREYERTSTVAMNAYLQPVMRNYLRSLDRRLRGARIFVMQSSGGITALDSAAKEPVRTVLSGPAGGAVGAAAMGRRSGFERIISFDMGGTSTDVALIDGEIHTSSQAEIAGLPIGVPMLDIQTAGAGGGSITRFDAGGALRVGPESAGADPGPICYGRGHEPTVTDANLILGRLQAEHFLGGGFQLDIGRTRRIVRAWLRKNRCTLSLEQFAWGVIRVVNATMEKAIRLVSIERGYDPREFALVAFGGAGGLHACELAQGLGLPRVIIPALPGALSAYGILASDVVKDYSRTVLWRAKSMLPTQQLEAAFTSLRHGADGEFRAEHWPGAVRFQASIDLRYRGQGYELNLPYSRGILQAFEREHQRKYGHSYPGRELELVTLRLRAVIKTPALKVAAERNRAAPSHAVTAPVFFGGKFRRAAVIAREQLKPGHRGHGPAVITEYSATTLIPPGLPFTVDAAGNLIIFTQTRWQRS